MRILRLSHKKTMWLEEALWGPELPGEESGSPELARSQRPHG